MAKKKIVRLEPIDSPLSSHFKVQEGAQAKRAAETVTEALNQKIEYHTNALTQLLKAKSKAESLGISNSLRSDLEEIMGYPF